jgi:ABC-type transport system substrate-binding protein
LPYDGDVVRPVVRTAVACLLAIGLTMSCGPSTADPPASPPAARAAAPTLTVAYAEPQAREVVERGIDRIVNLLSSERLVTIRRDGRPQPRLAERWQVSPDGLTWRLTLRDGLKFHDGQPITAAAVQAAIDLPSSPRDAETLPGLRDVVAIDAPTPREVVLRLKRPNAFVLESLNLAPIGSSTGAAAGPFRRTARTTGKAVLARFDGYYRGQPSLASIGIAEYPSQREAWSAMLRGDVDLLWDVAPDAFEFIKEAPNIHVATFLRPFVRALTFNVGHPVLGRREVRRALNLGVDRRLVIDATAGGQGLPATDHIWPNHWARDAAAPAYGFDLAAARALLDGAGLRPRTKAGSTSRFTFTCLVQDDPRYERLALLLQRQLLSLDVDMQLETLSQPEFNARLAAGRFDAFLTEVIAGHGLDLTYMMWHSKPAGPYFRTGYGAANVALDRLRDARSDDDTRTAVRALQRTMFDDPPAVFIYWQVASRAVSRRFVVPGADGQDPLSTIAQWQLGDGRQTGATDRAAPAGAARP